jgi:penicillin-binding protein 2
VPSREWKAGNSREPWYPGETVISGIGQGYWVATTLQLARATSAVAHGGLLPRLHLVADRRDGYRAPWRPLPQPAPRRITDNPRHLRAVQEGMMATMQPGGTGAAMAVNAPYLMAGKTGTAQKVSRKGNVSMNPHALPLHLRHQAWFIGYAPADDPKIAVAVMVEHGGYGASTAGPIARKIMDAWLLGTRPEPPVRKDGAPQAPKFDNVVSGPVLAWVPPPVPKATAAPAPQGAQAATQPPVETRGAGRPAP